jgi:hypothetical protein
MKFGALFSVILMLSATAMVAVAQIPPAAGPAAAPTVGQTSKMKTEAAAVGAQEKTASATWEQIRAIRTALRARLAALRH